MWAVIVVRAYIVVRARGRICVKLFIIVVSNARMCRGEGSLIWFFQNREAAR